MVAAVPPRADPVKVDLLCRFLTDAFEAFVAAEYDAGNGVRFVDAIAGLSAFYATTVLGMERQTGQAAFRRFAVDTIARALLSKGG